MLLAFSDSSRTSDASWITWSERRREYLVDNLVKNCSVSVKIAYATLTNSARLSFLRDFNTDINISFYSKGTTPFVLMGFCPLSRADIIRFSGLDQESRREAIRTVCTVIAGAAAVADTAEKALMDLLAKADADLCEIITLFTGKKVSAERRAALVDAIKEKYADCEVIVYEGGQELYDYYVALE